MNILTCDLNYLINHISDQITEAATFRVCSINGINKPKSKSMDNYDTYGDLSIPK